jgi:hypothetical protein
MFDEKVASHQAITKRIEKGDFKHLQVVTIDVGAVGWATEGSGSEAGKFEYDCNALIIVPSYMVAKDKTILSSSTAAQVYLFPNTKDNPGIPFSAIGSATFGDFAGMCCTMRQFYIYVAQADPGHFLYLFALKGVNLYGMGSKYSQVIGSYEG